LRPSMSNFRLCDTISNADGFSSCSTARVAPCSFALFFGATPVPFLACFPMTLQVPEGLCGVTVAAAAAAAAKAAVAAAAAQRALELLHGIFRVRTEE